MTKANLYEAYVAVYDEDLRDELYYIEEDDLSFIDDLTDSELTLVMEHLFITEKVDINECFESLDYFLTEAVTVTQGRGDELSRDAMRSRREARNQERRNKVRVGRVMRAAGKAAKSVGGNVVKGAINIGAKLLSAGQKVGKFLGRVGSAAKAGYQAARDDYSSSGSRVTRGGSRSTDRPTPASRVTGGASRVTGGGSRSTDRPDSSSSSSRSSGLGLRRLQARGRRDRPTWDPSAANRSARRRGVTVPPTSVLNTRGTGPSEHQKRIQDARQQQVSSARARLQREDFDILTELLLDTIINEGYAYDEACEIINLMSDYEIDQITENLILANEDIFRDNIFDDIFEYLLDEGFADTEEDAMTIMANMSKEWVDDILEANRGDQYATGGMDPQQAERVKQYRRLMRNQPEPPGTHTPRMDTRKFDHQASRGVKGPNSRNNQILNRENPKPGTYSQMQSDNPVEKGRSIAHGKKVVASRSAARKDIQKAMDDAGYKWPRSRVG